MRKTLRREEAPAPHPSSTTVAAVPQVFGGAPSPPTTSGGAPPPVQAFPFAAVAGGGGGNPPTGSTPGGFGPYGPTALAGVESWRTGPGNIIPTVHSATSEKAPAVHDVSLPVHRLAGNPRQLEIPGIHNL